MTPGRIDYKEWSMHATMTWFCVCLVLVTTVASISSAGEKTTVVHPQDTGTALVNPGMGWVLHHYDNIAFNYGGQARTVRYCR